MPALLRPAVQDDLMFLARLATSRIIRHARIAERDIRKIRTPRRLIIHFRSAEQRIQRAVADQSIMDCGAQRCGGSGHDNFSNVCLENASSAVGRALIRPLFSLDGEEATLRILVAHRDNAKHARTESETVARGHLRSATDSDPMRHGRGEKCHQQQ
jgi:hypothetical protein